MSKTLTLDKEVTLNFEDDKGNKTSITTDVKTMLSKMLDEFYDDLESPCNSSSCNNESQNFCDCGSEFEDYEIKSITI